MPPVAEGAQITPYLQYQTQLAWQQDSLRQARWAEVKSESDLKALQAETRASLLKMIGGLPQEKTPLHATITGRVAGDGFHVEKLIYQSLPGVYVTALVYVPEDGRKTHPAVLLAAGHSPKGKIYYQAISERLAKRGYIVLSWDPIGQGERSQFWDAKTGKSRYNLICAEHAVMGNLAYLAGANLVRWEVWDGIRAVDYLLSRPDVDGERLSLTGTSGGGTQAALLGALDERIKVIIPSCYITALPMRIHNRIFLDPDSDPEQDLFGSISNGVDHAGLLLLMYPRPVMLAAATLDFFPIQGVHKTYSEIRAIYQRFGQADRIGFAESYNKHQYSLKNQEAAFEFLDRFNHMPVRHELAAVMEFSDAALQVTKSGQVLVDYPSGRSFVQVLSAYYAEMAPHNQLTMADAYRTEQNPNVLSWTAGAYDGSAGDAQLRWEKVGTTAAGKLHIDRYVIHHSTYLAMPLLYFHADGKTSKGNVLWFSLDGKATQKDWPQIAKLVDEGYAVFSFDFRGLGETRMRYRAVSEDDPSLALSNFDHAYINPLSSVLADYVYNSLLTGRPYFLQMMDDIQIAARFAKSGPAQPAPQTPLLLAAGDDVAYTLATRFAEVAPEMKVMPRPNASVLSWSAIVSQEQEAWPIAFLMPSGGFIK
ncbi:MAG: acetylxylan esterase [Edaphobacter sp.]